MVFEQFLEDETINLIVDETNKYSKRYIAVDVLRQTAAMQK